MFTFHSVHLLNRSHNQHQFSSEKVLDRQIHHINCISPIYPSYYTLLTDDHMHAKWSGHYNFPHHFFYFSHLCCSQGFQIHLATSSNRILQDFLALEYFLAAFSPASSLNCFVMTLFWFCQKFSFFCFPSFVQLFSICHFCFGFILQLWSNNIDDIEDIVDELLELSQQKVHLPHKFLLL